MQDRKTSLVQISLEGVGNITYVLSKKGKIQGQPIAMRGSSEMV